jgi:glyoxylase-like metal-dependent hydrolase (beta-lactamase superfamily II)
MHNYGRRVALFCWAAALAFTAHGQPAAALSIMHVQGNVYMLYAGNDGNIAVQVGDDGVMLVNALREGLADEIVATIATVTPHPIRYIIDTSVDAHNAAGNAALAERGMFGATNSASQGATLVAHENVLLRWSLPARRGEAMRPEAGRPGDNYYLPQKDIYFNDEPVFVMHAPNAHSDGDSIVLFRKSDTIAVGDIFTPDAYPVIDVEYGGSVQGLIDALNHVLDLAVPKRLQDGGTRIVPGKGRLSNEADVVEYRDMVVIVRDRIQYMLDQGMSLREIMRAQPTLDYDTQYGSGDAFVQSIVASLSASR